MKDLYIAVDIGGSHGRVFSYTETDGLLLHHEFEPLFCKTDDKGNLCWNAEQILSDIVFGIKKILDIYRESVFITMGIDCFGNDFGLLGEDGELLFPVFHNKSARNRAHVGELASMLGGPFQLYRTTGIHDCYYDTANQLLAVRKEHPLEYMRIGNVMLLADLLGYWLTGIKASERTAMSVTQLYDPSIRDYSPLVVDALGIAGALNQLSEPGTFRGNMLHNKCPFLGNREIQFVNVAQHDTASSVLMTMDREDEVMFISSGTISVIGCFVPKPLKTKKSFVFGLSNETAVMDKIRLLKNVPGMYIVNQCRKAWGEDRFSYKLLDRLAIKEMDFPSEIDTEDPCFINPGSPDDPMPDRIVNWCAKHRQKAPGNIGQTLVAVYKGLAAKYVETMNQLQDATDKRFDRICIIGGGSRNQILDQMVADRSGLPVHAGPSEASASGNIVMQMKAANRISSFREGIGKFAADNATTIFLPNLNNG